MGLLGSGGPGMGLTGGRSAFRWQWVLSSHPSCRSPVRRLFSTARLGFTCIEPAFGSWAFIESYALPQALQRTVGTVGVQLCLLARRRRRHPVSESHPESSTTARVESIPTGLPVCSGGPGLRQSRGRQAYSAAKGPSLFGLSPDECAVQHSHTTDQFPANGRVSAVAWSDEF